MKKLIKNEFDLDEKGKTGSTVDPKGFQVTKELIDKVAKGDQRTYRSITRAELKICKVNKCWNSASWVQIGNDNYHLCNEHAKDKFKVPVFTGEERKTDG